ncbi:hypothetical protein U27_06613 [Candidatus Vecturithrix granuli]|uniref:Uncharacterized protein n=1 Tax=Vecturithrix granuli TaxID=1499967 RepID=A0A081C4X3_VECG1|nr:hypothetical protein U27_06613 [Candidatus Vecturithrix granuli]
MFGDALIFFDYAVKKKGSLGAVTYRYPQQKKERYENAYRHDVQQR